jgi:hypothetical protein
MYSCLKPTVKDLIHCKGQGTRLDDSGNFSGFFSVNSFLFHQIEHGIDTDMPVGGEVLIEVETLKDFIHIQVPDLFDGQAVTQAYQ